MKANTSLAALGELAHHMQCRTDFKIQTGKKNDRNSGQ